MKNHILIAEDDEDDRILLREAFAAAGGRVDLQFAENGNEVLNSLKSGKTCPRVILLDLNMPQKDGYQVLKELKSNPDFNAIPVIVFSTSQMKDQIKKCYQLGASTYIVKPETFSGLVAIANAILSYWIDTAALPPT
jgi:CheY-like chemotaxis protein